MLVALSVYLLVAPGVYILVALGLYKLVAVGGRVDSPGCVHTGSPICTYW